MKESSFLESQKFSNPSILQNKQYFIQLMKEKYKQKILRYLQRQFKIELFETEIFFDATINSVDMTSLVVELKTGSERYTEESLIERVQESLRQELDIRLKTDTEYYWKKGLIEKRDEAISKLFECYFDRLSKGLFKRGAEASQVESIFHDSIFILIKNLQRGKVITNIYAYLQSIVYNSFRWGTTKVKSNSTLPLEEDQLNDIKYSILPNDLIESSKSERIKLILECLEEIRPNCKALIMAKFYENLTNAEIRDKFNIAETSTNQPTQNTNSRIYRCMRHLRKLVNDKFKK